jgi:hypothetical protein
MTCQKVSMRIFFHCCRHDTNKWTARAALLTMRRLIRKLISKSWVTGWFFGYPTASTPDATLIHNPRWREFY